MGTSQVSSHELHILLFLPVRWEDETDRSFTIIHNTGFRYQLSDIPPDWRLLRLAGVGLCDVDMMGVKIANPLFTYPLYSAIFIKKFNEMITTLRPANSTNLYIFFRAST